MKLAVNLPWADPYNAITDWHQLPDLGPILGEKFISEHGEEARENAHQTFGGADYNLYLPIHHT